MAVVVSVVVADKALNRKVAPAKKYFIILAICKVRVITFHMRNMCYIFHTSDWSGIYKNLQFLECKQIFLHTILYRKLRIYIYICYI